MKRYFTAQEAADTLSVSKRLIQKLVANGQLIACKVGRCIRISEESLEEYARRNQVVPAAVPNSPATKYKPGDRLV